MTVDVFHAGIPDYRRSSACYRYERRVKTTFGKSSTAFSFASLPLSGNIVRGDYQDVAFLS